MAHDARIHEQTAGLHPWGGRPVSMRSASRLPGSRFLDDEEEDWCCEWIGTYRWQANLRGALPSLTARNAGHRSRI